MPSIFDGPRYSRALLHLRLAISTDSWCGRRNALLPTPDAECKATALEKRGPRQGGVSEELRSQNLSFPLLTQAGRRPRCKGRAWSPAVVSVDRVQSRLSRKPRTADTMRSRRPTSRGGASRRCVVSLATTYGSAFGAFASATT